MCYQERLKKCNSSHDDTWLWWVASTNNNKFNTNPTYLNCPGLDLQWPWSPRLTDIDICQVAFASRSEFEFTTITIDAIIDNKKNPTNVRGSNELFIVFSVLGTIYRELVQFEQKIKYGIWTKQTIKFKQRFFPSNRYRYSLVISNNV